MAANPTRRRWSYSLRTMFVVVTALAVFLGWLTWEWRFVRERHLSRFKYANKVVRDSAHPDLPFWRVWLGDESFLQLDLVDGISDSDLDRIHYLYPEATLVHPHLNRSGPADLRGPSGP